jgi:hypothetical protein
MFSMVSTAVAVRLRRTNATSYAEFGSLQLQPGFLIFSGDCPLSPCSDFGGSAHYLIKPSSQCTRVVEGYSAISMTLLKNTPVAALGAKVGTT